MKNTIFLTIALALIFNSCAKEEFITPDQYKHVSDNQLKAGKAEDWGLNWRWNSVKMVCEKPPRDCFDEITVYGKSENISTNPAEELDRHLTSDPATLQEFFSSGKYEAYFKQLPPEYIEKLKSGKYSAIKLNNKSTTFYLFGKKGEFNKNNPEFVIPVVYDYA